MLNFKIADTELYPLADSSEKEFTVYSHPESYRVSFRSINQSFSSNQVVLVDENVKNLYGIKHDKLISIKPSEDIKSIETVLDICEKLLEFKFDKGNELVVIGGGITQDLGAYTAKTFKRGIKWTYIPTTLLSQCDSCIGGKTALNFKQYKNQLALFSAPNRVIIDSNYIKTLNRDDMISGMGEIVKLFLTGGSYYVDNFKSFSLQEKVFHSLAIKKAVIEKDEFENLERKSLNYGHSFGHAIEAVTKYQIPHGEAVLLGIEIINKLFDNNPQITAMVEKLTSLRRIKNISAKDLVSVARTDKKVKNGVISLVVVPEAGVTKFVETPLDKNLEKKLHEVLVS